MDKKIMYSPMLKLSPNVHPTMAGHARQVHLKEMRSTMQSLYVGVSYFPNNPGIATDEAFPIVRRSDRGGAYKRGLLQINQIHQAEVCMWE